MKKIAFVLAATVAMVACAALVDAEQRWDAKRGLWAPNNDESKVGPYTLEDPLTFLDGTKVKSPADWPRRRAEILGIFAREMYGEEPPKPESLVTDVVSEKETADGYAIRRIVKMYFRSDRTGPCVTWGVWIPRFAKGKVPAVEFLTYRGLHELVMDDDIPVSSGWSRNNPANHVSDHNASEKTRGRMCDHNQATIFPLQMLLARGYAVVASTYTEVSPDPNWHDKDVDQYRFATTNGVFALWGERDESRTDNITSLGAWAWALSRGLDLAERMPEIDAKRVVVTGCSRLGKSALLAAARDERFAVCVPNQCGGGGVCLAKRDFGENVSTEMKNFPHWYCKAYAKYAPDPAKLLTFDQHLLVATIAPRPLLVEGFGPNNWMDTKAEYLACKAASPAWELFGLQGLPGDGYPEYYDTSAIGTHLGYVRRTQNHGISGYDWTWLLDFADRAFEAGGTSRTTGLTTCRLCEPANVVTPVFAWKMESSRRGASQSAYRIKVYEAAPAGAKSLTWDSGVVETGASVGIRYGGPALKSERRSVWDVLGCFGLRQSEALKSARRYVWEVTVRDDRGVWLKPAQGSFETGLAAADWAGSKWISAADSREATKEEIEKTHTSAPGTACFAKTVENSKAVVEAYWTVTGLGVFEAYVNGRPVSRKLSCGKVVRDALKPGFTHAYKTKHSFTYDVTHLLKTGAGERNVFSAMVSAGWWRDKIVKYAGKKSAFRAVLVLRHADGTEERVGTDESWGAAVAGPVKRAAIFDGEFYDARADLGWMTGAAAGFRPAVENNEFKGEIVPMEGPAIGLREDLALPFAAAYAWKGVDGADDTKFGKVRVLRTYKAGDEIALDPGETLVVDFAQNAAAVPEFVARAAEGVTMTIVPAEMLNAGDGLKSRGNDGPEGSVYRANLRKLQHDGATCEYVFAGSGEAAYRPEFTFYGYRYASISATGRVVIKSLRSVPVTSIPRCLERGVLSTGVADVNKLVSNVRWGQYSNYLSVPTDCPQRNERLGWAADTQVFCEAASYNADVYGFLGKWMRDMRDTQHDNGSFPGVAPFAQYGSEASEEIGWSDAGVIVPYVMWRQHGDATIVDDNWDAMERYVALVAANKFDSPRGNNHQWADWLSFEDYESAGGGLGKRISAWETKPDGKKGPRKETLVYWHFLGGCYWLWDAKMMAAMAEATGRTAAAEKYSRMADDALAYLRENFVDKSDGMLLGLFRANQTPALFALKFGILEDEKAVAATKAALLKNIADHKGCLTTGFLGTSILMDVLTYDAGAPETAYSLLLQHENPSWLYSVDQGATTIWERWNSYVKATGFGPVGMNSFNHYAYGAVLAWMYGTMAGIREDEKAPGFKHVILAPVPDKRMGHVEACYDSAYGRIMSAWRYGADGRWSWKFSIPANVTATVVVPGESPREFVSGDYLVVR